MILIHSQRMIPIHPQRIRNNDAGARSPVRSASSMIPQRNLSSEQQMPVADPQRKAIFSVERFSLSGKARKPNNEIDVNFSENSMSPVVSATSDRAPSTSKSSGAARRKSREVANEIWRSLDLQEEDFVTDNSDYYFHCSFSRETTPTSDQHRGDTEAEIESAAESKLAENRAFGEEVSKPESGNPSNLASTSLCKAIEGIRHADCVEISEQLLDTPTVCKNALVWTLNASSGSASLYSWAIGSAAIFVLVALVLSMYLIFEHLSSYNQPEEQKFLIGLILMVPVYALESFLSLLDSKAAFNYEVIRDCYEAFALYCFERYLIACLGGEKNTIEFIESHSMVTSSAPLLDEVYAYGVVEHPFPLNCFISGWSLGPEFYQAVKVGIVQYMLLKMICALLAMVFQFFGIYGEGKFEWKYAYPYLAVVLNFSQTWALYCLVQFYSVTKNKLEPIKPLAKFLVFKSIVFLTWWLAVAFLFSYGAFKGRLAQVLKTRIQDYIICIEMGIAAVVHLYVFPAAPYKRGKRCVRNVSVMADYASLDSPPDPEEVKDCERTTRVRAAQHVGNKFDLLHTQYTCIVSERNSLQLASIKFQEG